MVFSNIELTVLTMLDENWTDIMFFYRAALLQLNWTIFINDELTSAKQWHLFFRAALHQK